MSSLDSSGSSGAAPDSAHNPMAECDRCRVQFIECVVARDQSVTSGGQPIGIVTAGRRLWVCACDVGWDVYETIELPTPEQAADLRAHPYGLGECACPECAAPATFEGYCSACHGSC